MKKEIVHWNFVHTIHKYGPDRPLRTRLTQKRLCDVMQTTVVTYIHFYVWQPIRSVLYVCDAMAQANARN